MDEMGWFNTTDQTISLRSERYLQEEQVILEELLHALQYYLCGSSYMSAKKNVEYEVKVIRDVICGSNGSYYGIVGNESNEYIRDYRLWIFCLQTGLYNPKTGNFNQYAALWNGESNATYDNNFEPRLLFMCINELKESRK